MTCDSENWWPEISSNMESLSFHSNLCMRLPLVLSHSVLKGPALRQAFTPLDLQLVRPLKSQSAAGKLRAWH